MSQDNFQEKTEKATPRRREKAREEGKVIKSQELNSAAIITLGFLSLYAVGPNAIEQIKMMFAYNLRNAPVIASSDPTFAKIFGDSMVQFFTIMFPVFAAMAVIGFGINVVQVGFKISPKGLEPKLDKLNIVNGAKKLFAMKSLVQLVRDSIKLAVIGFVGYKAIESEFESFFQLPDMTIAQIAGTMVQLAVVLAMKIGAIVLIIAVIDYAYQKYEFEKSIKMSKQEIKDEHKDTERSPQIKSKVRQLQREISRNRMMNSVPEADVVITNPTHIAVALKYDSSVHAAPFVVAKGERLLAQKIKEIAYDHDIPVIEDKPLARALFKICEIEQIVPMHLYRAVAEILAYVYRLKGKLMS